ncbi:MAG: hypothetical protein WCG90_08380 [Chitinophagia bacterium]
MNLTKTALKAINNQRTRLSLALALDVTEQTIIRYITDNHDNLTKAAAMKVIKQETGFSDEKLLQSVEAK